MVITHFNKLSPEQQESFRLISEKDVLSSAFVSEYMPLLQKSKNPLALIERFSYNREAVLRTAMALYQIERDKKGLPLWAPEINIKGLDTRSAIGKIAREFTVDYNAISPAYRRFLRGLITPFIRFFEGNVRNWTRYAKYAPLAFLAKYVVPKVAEWVYNNTQDRKEIEENLPQYFRYTSHLVLKGWDLDGDGKNDKALIWSTEDPLMLAAAWYGLDRLLSKVTDIRAGRLTVEEAAKQQLIDMGLGAPRQIERLLNPAIQTMQGLLSNRDPYTNMIIVPERLKGTSKEKILQMQYVREKFCIVFAQTARLERGTDPLTNPIVDWFLNGPGDIKRGLGFYTVDLTTEPARVEMNEQQKMRGLRNEYLDRIEQRIILEQNFSDIREEAREKGINLTYTDIINRRTDLRVRIESIKEKLRSEHSPVAREMLEKQLLRLRELGRRERRKKAPVATRRSLYKKLKEMRR